jgi:hypothetical protein
MPKFYGAIDLVKNELQNAIIQNLGTAPSSPTKGQIYFNSTDNILYYYDGTAWTAAKGGAPGGAAGGDLGGTYPNPTVVKASGDFTVTGGETILNGASGLTIQDVQLQRTAVGALTLGATQINLLANTDLNNKRITRLSDPLSTNDAATKNYVDSVASGLQAKHSVKAATTGNVVLNPSPGAVDGVTLVNGDRVLVKSQTAPAENGIYYVNAGILFRAQDTDVWTELVSAYCWVEQGTVNADTGWVCTVDTGGTIGTTPVTWAQFNGAPATTAGAGLTKTGNQIDVIAGDATLTVAADSIIVNQTIVAMKSDLTALPHKYSQVLVGTTSPEVVTHNLNTQDILVGVHNGVSPFTAAEVDWDATSLNTVTLRFNPVLGAGYRVVVMG